MPNSLPCSAVEVFPLELIFIQQGRCFLYLLLTLKAQAPWEQCGISHTVLWPEGEPGDHLPAEISRVQRYIPWTSSPTLWLISSFSLQFSVPEASMKNANKVIICNFCTISFQRSSFQSRAVSQVHLKNCDFVIRFNRRRIFALSCKRSQLYITDFYFIS